MNICVAVLTLKMEENTQHFGVLCFISRKVKTQLKHKKRFVQCVEKVLGLGEYVKSGLQSFVLEISRWMMLHSQTDQSELTAIRSRH